MPAPASLAACGSTLSRAASPESRDRLARTAQREFRVLEGVDHPGILRALDFRETELGPALVFDHDPSGVRLDRFLAARLNGFSLDERLALPAVGLSYTR